jgi:hypothetical protein
MSGFQIKTFPDITADMIARLRASTTKVTDFNVGSVVRALLEAPALEVDELYQSMYYGLLESVPTAIYTGFGFDVLPATAASGWVTATVETARQTDTAIPEGLTLTAYDGTTYSVAEAAVLYAGEVSVVVRVVATVAGASGNQPARAIDSTIAGIRYLSGDISAGRDAETPTQRAERFAAYIRALARGTLGSIEYAAGLVVIYADSGVAIERVERAATAEEAWHVFLYIHNGSGATSAALVDQVQVAVDGYRDDATGSWVGGYRPAGMRVEVVAMDDVSLDMVLEVRAAINYQTDATKFAIAREISEALRSIRPGDDLRPVDIRNAALAANGVDAVTVFTPAETIPGRLDAVLQLGTLDVTWTV